MQKIRVKSVVRWFAILLLAALLYCVGLNRLLFAQPPLFGGHVEQSGASLSGFIWPRADVYFLSENTLWVQSACKIGLRRLPVSGVIGTLIGIDFRVAKGLLYGIDDAGLIYKIDAQGNATPVSFLTVLFGGDMRSLADFNPVANALRLIGANDQNFAVTNTGGDLAKTVPQAPIAYAQGDVNFGQNPNLAAGAYTNNVIGATVTLFYGIDYDLDTFVTIAPPLNNGSSNTGGGQIQTIGKLVDFVGRPFDLDKDTDLDIYTVNGVNKLIGFSNGRIFSIDLAQINPSLPVGQTQAVRVRWLPLPGAGRFIDLAIGPQVSCQ